MSNDETEYPLGEMVMMDGSEYDELCNDLEYWNLTSMMLSEMLTEHGIEHEISNEFMAKYLASKRSTMS